MKAIVVFSVEGFVADVQGIAIVNDDKEVPAEMKDLADRLDYQINVIRVDGLRSLMEELNDQWDELLREESSPA